MAGIYDSVENIEHEVNEIEITINNLLSDIEDIPEDATIQEYENLLDDLYKKLQEMSDVFND